MRRFGQYCPVAAALDMLGDRWSLLIVRDLLDGELHFNEIARGLPRLSRSLLSRRLRELEGYGVIARRAGPAGTRTTYRLTAVGEAARPVVEALSLWGAVHAFEEPHPEELDPLLLLWWMRRRVLPDRLPPERSVAQFDFRGDDASYWLVLTRHETSVCLTRPPFDIDLWIDADLAAFFEVWLGRVDFAAAVADGRIDVRALPALERAFPSWFAWSPAAELIRSLRRRPAARTA